MSKQKGTTLNITFHSVPANGSPFLQPNKDHLLLHHTLQNYQTILSRILLFVPAAAPAPLSNMSSSGPVHWRSNKTDPLGFRLCSPCRHSKCVSVGWDADNSEWLVSSGMGHENWRRRRTCFGGCGTVVVPSTTSSPPLVWSCFAKTVVVVRREMSRNFCLLCCCCRSCSAAAIKFRTSHPPPLSSSPTTISDGAGCDLDCSVPGDTSIVSGINKCTIPTGALELELSQVFATLHQAYSFSSADDDNGVLIIMYDKLSHLSDLHFMLQNYKLGTL